MANIQTNLDGIPKYPKIDTLFERDAQFIVDPTKLKSPVLGTISSWAATEKIDGTNVRVALTEQGDVIFGGRSNRAQIHTHLLQALVKMFPAEFMREELWADFGSERSVVLFGEGYGAGIQKGGGAYREDKSFILFDVLVGEQWWMKPSDVDEVGRKLGIDVVPHLGLWTLDKIVEVVREPTQSSIGSAVSEGIVARPIETLFDTRGKRIIVKLKTKDFQSGKR